MKNRYPGTQPFTAEQKNLFHGRKQETEDLMKLIRFHQMVVLYGKSGLGKSSLLNTKIKQEIEAHKITDVFAVRFNAWTEEGETPLRKTVEALFTDSTAANSGKTSAGKTSARFETSPTLLGTSSNPLAPIADNTLWYAAKARQLTTGRQRFLLVFDQFEELFTYPDETIQDFKESLAELMRAGLPKRIEEAVKTLPLSDDDLDTLYETADIKVLFAIRSDRMHLLDKLSDVLPDILRHCYELKALVAADAREAVVKPADLEGDFSAPRFTYTEGALTDMLTFLKDEDGRIEAIQLQTLCQAFERTIQKAGQSITAADTPTEKLKDIIDHYYKTQIDDPRIGDKHTAQRLIEDELVIETGDGKGVRVTLHELSILVKFANRDAHETTEKERLKQLLEALVNVHLLRREVGSRGGDTYELSHDRLIEPVVKSKKVYVAEVERANIAKQKSQQETELAEAKQQAQIEKQRAEEAEKLKNNALTAKKKAQYALAIASLLLLLALGGFGYAQQKQQEAQASENKANLNFDLAQKRAEEAKQNADAATAARLEAEKNLIFANEQKDIAKTALEQAKINLQKAQQAEAKAIAEQIKTQKALNDAKTANERVAKAYIRDIEQHILNLEYEAAAKKCETALALNIDTQKPTIAQYVFEIAYWFTETDTAQAAVNTLKMLSINVLPNQEALRKAIEANVPPQYFTVLKERYYPKMIQVEGGTFTMGSNDNDRINEKPPHPVKLSRFKMAETETTVWQYFLFQKATKHVVPQSPTWQWQGDNPIVYVSWLDAVSYLKWLSTRLNKSFRLPTEAEWEFAARGGNGSKNFIYSGSNNVKDVSWYGAPANSRTHAVKSLKVNELGLFDMSGNVWEWCADKFDAKYYEECASKGIVENPQGSQNGRQRLLRGGSWSYKEDHSRVSYRDMLFEEYKDDIYGFRVLQDK
jgi:formylglycine-generating enzyme required for sulfatase activity